MLGDFFLGNFAGMRRRCRRHENLCHTLIGLTEEECL